MFVIYQIYLKHDKDFTYNKTSGQAVDAPVKKCVLTKQKEENFYE
jgi:hypothetical protein